MQNVLKVFLENGQTKTFKVSGVAARFSHEHFHLRRVFTLSPSHMHEQYDATTCVQDVLNSVADKLSIKWPQHYALCGEHTKTPMRRTANRLVLLDPKEPLVKIASRPGAHNLRCIFRLAFVPKDITSLLQHDPLSFEYLYVQCCNDVVMERLNPEIKYEISLRLAALQLHQHAISNGT